MFVECPVVAEEDFVVQQNLWTGKHASFDVSLSEVTLVGGIVKRGLNQRVVRGVAIAELARRLEWSFVDAFDVQPAYFHRRKQVATSHRFFMTINCVFHALSWRRRRHQHHVISSEYKTNNDH